jgi:hypothetical protein
MKKKILLKDAISIYYVSHYLCYQLPFSYSMSGFHKTVSFDMEKHSMKE